LGEAIGGTSECWPIPSPTVSANPQTVAKGNPVTLSWSATNAGYYVLSPQVGAIRGTSIMVVPTLTTTYTLSVTNQYGRSTATVKVVVQ